VTFFAPWMGPLLVARAGASAGGAETQMLMLARALQRRGLRVALVVFEVPEGLPSDYEGIRVVEVPGSTARSQLFRVGLRVARVVRTLLALPTAVLVQRIAGPETGLLALLCRLRRIRFVYSSANVVDFDYDRLQPGKLRVALFHLGVRLAEEVVVQTSEQVALCQRRFDRTPVVIKSVAEPATPSGNVPEAFLWVGRTDWYKRPEAYVQLARAVPEARFWMIPMPMDEGGMQRVEELRREADELPNLDLLDARPRAELTKLIPAAVAIVNTSDYEGMPNVFLEGWTRGVPALALTHDPDGVIQREGLGGFAGGSTERFAELTRELWATRADRGELAERCRAYARREHSEQAIVDRWLAALALRASP
jgi:glycosyltransferase involved in cell wall biosynthesis